MSKLGSFEEEYARIKLDVTATEEECGIPILAEDNYDQLLSLPSESKLILYVCDHWNNNPVIEFLEHNSIKFHGVCFASPRRSGIHPDTGFEYLSHDTLSNINTTTFILITSEYADSKVDLLIERGFPSECILKYPLGDGAPPLIFAAYFEKDCLEGYEYAYNQFIDDESRRVLLGIIRKYLIGNKLSQSSDCPQYFDKDLITLENNEVFLDGGAYNGVSVEGFITQCKKDNVNYKQIYSFEPDTYALSLLYSELKDTPRLEVIEKGLWHEDTTLEFVLINKGTTSAVFDHYEGERASLPVTSLDKFFADKPQEYWPTFIKLDIEGAEQETLLGAKNVITTMKPKMALCVYHRHTDVYELLRMAQEYNPDYKFSLRQHEDGHHEQVLYCI